MESPVPLDAEAAAFWGRHAGRLAAAGVLTAADLDSFAVLCMTWSKLQQLRDTIPGAESYREMIQLTNLLKQYQALARQFALLPRERKQAKMSTDPAPEKDEFDL